MERPLYRILSIDGGGVNFDAVAGGYAVFEARGYLITNAK